MSKLAGGRPSLGPAPLPAGYERVQTGTQVQYVGPQRYLQPAETISESEYKRRLSKLDAQAPAQRWPSAWGGAQVGPLKQFKASWKRHEVPIWEIRPIATAASGVPGAPAPASAPAPAPAVASPAPPSGGPQPAPPGEPITPAKSVMPAPVVLGSGKSAPAPKPLGRGRTSKFFVKAPTGLMADEEEEAKKQAKLKLGA